MSTFTQFERASLERYLVMFGVGELVAYEPIGEGIENTNYLVTTTQHEESSEFVLTILEDITFDEVPFFNQLTSHLAHYGLPVPAPRRTLDGMSMTVFCGKPTLLVDRLPGGHILSPDADACRAIGKALGDIHSVSTAGRFGRENPYDSLWQGDVIASHGDSLAAPDRQLLGEVNARYGELEALSLPRGIIHGDLFRDNALFQDGNLTGIIDFYHACDDFLVQDIAVCLNDWCRAADGSDDVERVEALLSGYESVRPLEAEEREHLEDFRAVSAARFTLTRLLSGGDGEPLKDPTEFLPLIRRHYEP